MASFESLDIGTSMSETQRDGIMHPCENEINSAFTELDRGDDKTLSDPDIGRAPARDVLADETDAAAALISLASSSPDAAVTQGVDMQAADDSTEVKIGIMMSFHPNANIAALLKILVSSEGSVEKAIDIIPKILINQNGKRPQDASDATQERRSRRPTYQAPALSARQLLAHHQNRAQERSRGKVLPMGMEALMSRGSYEKYGPPVREHKTDSNGYLWEWKGEMRGDRRVFKKAETGYRPPMIRP